MQLSEIREEVQLIVQDSVFTDEIVDSYINDVYFSTISECLVPEMKGMDTVTTDPLLSYVSMTGVSGGFSGILSRVYNSDGEAVTILPTLETLMDINGKLDVEGSVEVVALEGGTLWYYPSPAAAETLTVIYYKNPVALSADGDAPEVLPEFLHRKILVNGAASLCFDKLEDGVDSLKPNTQSRELSRREGLVRFREWLGKNRKHYVSTQEPY